MCLGKNRVNFAVRWLTESGELYLSRVEQSFGSIDED